MAQDTNEQLWVFINPGEEDDPEELERVTVQLRRELLDTDVDTVEQVLAGPAPVGTRAADPITIGALLVAFGASGSVFPKLIDVLQAWVTRNDKRSITIEDKDGNKVTINAHSANEEQKLIQEWKERRTVPLGKAE